MSYNYQAKVIWGFPLDKYPSHEFLGKDDEGLQVYLNEWLEGYRPVEQINAGPVNDGTASYLVGVEVCLVDDFTRATPYKRLMLPARQEAFDKLVRAARLLGAKSADIGYYVVGVRG